MLQPVTTPVPGSPQEQTIWDDWLIKTRWIGELLGRWIWWGEKERRKREGQGSGAYGNTEALDIADVDEWRTVVVARFDQAATVDVVGIIVFADGDATGPVGGIDGFERVANGAVAGVADCGWGAGVVAEGGVEAAGFWLACVF